jgi:hypothetical protein
MTETRAVSAGQEIADAPRRFEEAIRLLGVWLTQGRWAPEVHWPAQEDLSVRGTSVILRQPVSPSGIDQQRARYRRGLVECGKDRVGRYRKIVWSDPRRR